MREAAAGSNRLVFGLRVRVPFVVQRVWRSEM